MDADPEDADPGPSPHVIEPATTGRSGCRACGQKIARGELRFGERIPNPFADGETTLWFHPLCAAYRRPEALLEVLATAVDLPDRETLESTARAAAAHRRLARVGGAERAPTGQAKCRACREPITRGTWRVRLVFVEEGRTTPGGFVHLACRQTYFEGHDASAAIRHFSAGLDDGARADLEEALAGSG
jgi:hypothetical protein